MVLLRGLRVIAVIGLVLVCRSTESEEPEPTVRVFSAFARAGEPPAQCAAVFRCLAQYISPSLSLADIQRLKAEHRTCFADDQDELAHQEDCLPVIVGVDSKVGRQIEVIYTCSDVCPRYGGILVRYVGVEKKECCTLGGSALHESAFGGYLGCAPPAVFAPATCPDWPEQSDDAAEEERLVRELLQ